MVLQHTKQCCSTDPLCMRLFEGGVIIRSRHLFYFFAFNFSVIKETYGIVAEFFDVNTNVVLACNL